MTIVRNGLLSDNVTLQTLALMLAVMFQQAEPSTLKEQQ